MSTCIIAATSLEIQPLLNQIQNGSGIHTLITGIGATHTTYQLTEHLQHHKPSLIIQAGIAGSFHKKLPLCSAVSITHDRFADLGVEENHQWRDVFDMQLAEPNTHPYTDGWLINPHTDLLDKAGLLQVKALTINEVTTSQNRIQTFNDKYKPDIESMEGAAFHYVCLQHNIPFIQIRTISNYVGDRNKNNWQIKEAIAVLSEKILTIIRHSSIFPAP